MAACASNYFAILEMGMQSSFVCVVVLVFSFSSNIQWKNNLSFFQIVLLTHFFFHYFFGVGWWVGGGVSFTRFCNKFLFSSAGCPCSQLKDFLGDICSSNACMSILYLRLLSYYIFSFEFMKDLKRH